MFSIASAPPAAPATMLQRIRTHDEKRFRCPYRSPPTIEDLDADLLGILKLSARAECLCGKGSGAGHYRMVRGLVVALIDRYGHLLQLVPGDQNGEDSDAAKAMRAVVRRLHDDLATQKQLHDAPSTHRGVDESEGTSCTSHLSPFCFERAAQQLLNAAERGRWRLRSLCAERRRAAEDVLLAAEESSSGVVKHLHEHAQM